MRCATGDGESGQSFWHFHPVLIFRNPTAGCHFHWVDIEAKIVEVLHDVLEDSKPPHRWGLQELSAEGFPVSLARLTGQSLFPE
jgi:hypothetical protein